MNEKEEEQLIAKWFAENDEVVLHYFPKEDRMIFYPSAHDFVHGYLAKYEQMAVCVPFYNAMTKRMNSLQAIASGERTEGRPLSFERATARDMIEKGRTYELTLYLIATVKSSPLYESPPASGLPTEIAERPRLTREEAKRIRNAVDREWMLQHDEVPPSPPRYWWKDPSRVLPTRTPETSKPYEGTQGIEKKKRMPASERG